MSKNTKIFIFIMLILCLLIYGISQNDTSTDSIISSISSIKNQESFKIIASSENEDLDSILKEYADENNIDLTIEYAGTLDIMEKLNNGEEYDGVLMSNSIWLYMLNDDVNTSDSKSTSITPVIFAIKKSKAEELGFVDKEIYTKDIVDAINDGKLTFSMSNPTRTNSGASAYLGLLSTLAGNPEILNDKILQEADLKAELKSFFGGMERSSGSEEFLEEMFLNGSYDAVVTYESSIINLNKQLEKNGEEPLYALYPVDGVSISDSPFAYIDNGDDDKEEVFLKLRDYLLSSEGQEKLASLGRRTWFGGVDTNADKTVFNPEWGIDTSKYIVPIKFPSTDIIQKALNLYQTELRKPTAIAFCLDYSGSMNTKDGKDQLVDAMDYLLTEEDSSKDLLQFTKDDIIIVLPFSNSVLKTWYSNGEDTDELKSNIENLKPTGATSIYETSIEAIKDLNVYFVNNELNIDDYNLSVVLMTDGMNNVGSLKEFKRDYTSLKTNIPIYSIMFGSADESELQNIATYTNGKVFDGKTNLIKAFKEVRGYN